MNCMTEKEKQDITDLLIKLRGKFTDLDTTTRYKDKRVKNSLSMISKLYCHTNLYIIMDNHYQDKETEDFYGI